MNEQYLEVERGQVSEAAVRPPLNLHVEAVGSISPMAPTDWDQMVSLASPGAPFLRWNFLSALEDSGCVGGGTGWTPEYLLARDDTGALQGAMPLYRKAHSMGEYVFDQPWANALTRASIPYYPKLQCAVPFTPVPGARVLTVPGDPSMQSAIRDALVRAALLRVERTGASSLHVTFHDADERALFAAHGMSLRTGTQFHFTNAGYRSFEDFLLTLSSSRRKNLRKERERAKEGRTIARLIGSDITHEDWDFFFRCYMDTGTRKWGTPYLNRRFFDLLAERMADSCLLFVARENGERIAAALNIFDDQAIYGRYWGCVADVPFLHFELCYYQAIDFALERGLVRVEAGAQGEHKLLRGYAPVATYSSHWIRHPGLRAAVEAFLLDETRAVNAEMELQRDATPFRKPE